MQIAIKISEEDYERLKEYEKAPFYSLTSRVYEAIANGTPLPKGHGRLIDADGLKHTFETEEDAEICKWSTYGVTSEIDDADTIIPATEGE